ncbi:unnamed protein product [Phytophthora fragariaefolia]|uniref:Unnamed protein product n=1 Tax=Phytophthora fragariaefolia TaxID=1490495 RepID=A0A9W7D239_9STRA|nr:unnamed protein product [Phytophthora fragariaefolia]
MPVVSSVDTVAFTSQGLATKHQLTAASNLEQYGGEHKRYPWSREVARQLTNLAASLRSASCGGSGRPAQLGRSRLRPRRSRRHRKTPPRDRGANRCSWPALSVIAAALSGQQYPGRAAQPEHELDEDAAGAAEEEAAVGDRDTRDKKNGKMDLRNIKVNAFSGTVQSGDFDVKAREFRDELDEQIVDAQVLAGQSWSDEAKKTVLKTFLTGMTRRWCREWCRANPAASYADAGDALVHNFRPVLLGVDIADRIKNERKRWNETYREFADRLLQMADALEGGKTQRANARCALVAFVRNAYPKHTDFLETKTDFVCRDPE